MINGITHFRRRKCTVLRLNPIKTNNTESDYRENFTVNGIHMNLEFGKEIDLLEPVYNALKSNVRIDHYLKTVISDASTGEVRQIDEAKEVKQYNVVEHGDWYWPTGHSPYGENGELIRHDLTPEELEKAPKNLKAKELAKAV